MAIRLSIRVVGETLLKQKEAAAAAAEGKAQESAVRSHLSGGSLSGIALAKTEGRKSNFSGQKALT